MNTHDNTTGTEQITNSERQRTASGMPVIRIPQKVYETIAEGDYRQGRRSAVL